MFFSHFSCFESNLNGEYFYDMEDNGYYRGIVWELWLGDYSLKSSVMMVRPRELPPLAPSLPTVPAPDPYQSAQGVVKGSPLDAFTDSSPANMNLSLIAENSTLNLATLPNSHFLPLILPLLLLPFQC